MQKSISDNLIKIITSLYKMIKAFIIKQAICLKLIKSIYNLIFFLQLYFYNTVKQ
jgi:hypothetical protein